MTGLVCEYDFEPHQGPCRFWAGKPAATSGNIPVQVFESAKLGTENRVLPATVGTGAGSLADTYKEAST